MLKAIFTVHQTKTTCFTFFQSQQNNIIIIIIIIITMYYNIFTKLSSGIVRLIFNCNLLEHQHIWHK